MEVVVGIAGGGPDGVCRDGGDGLGVGFVVVEASGFRAVSFGGDACVLVRTGDGDCEMGLTVMPGTAGLVQDVTGVTFPC